MKINNSLTKTKEELKPIVDKTINMYSCGVTVYDKCHIGHARSLYIFDVIRKYLKYRGYKVNFIRNITDVDDKIINKAKESNKTFEEVVEENISLYRKDVENLGIDFADIEPRATENIDGMIKYVEGLIEKGYAYESDGDVYFSVRQFKDYGKLSGQSIEKMQEAVRIDKDLKKKDPLDFVLWKAAKEDEPSWKSPWGDGRPGWHIECSVMSMKYLGCETLDIHAGGRDLIFPHHENEIAQSEALTGKPFANYWIHHGLLTIDGQKMAKSLGNFITVEDALIKYKADYLKLLFLSSHYASSVDFSDDKMIEMKKVYEKISILLDKLKAVKYSSCDTSEYAKQRLEEFEESMDDDFNTPKAMSVLFDVIHQCNKELEKESEESLCCLKKLIETILDVFGLKSFKRSDEEVVSKELEELLNDRIEARKNKDFKRSDEIRDELKKQGIIVEDGKGGQTWRRL
ncbi:MAG: cysteine--tRNA ligase [Candidatus Zapsychrus exili]|nr:cysteine--tRNA ligase [Candidatus Zapsychrus exili]